MFYTNTNINTIVSTNTNENTNISTNANCKYKTTCTIYWVNNVWSLLTCFRQNWFTKRLLRVMNNTNCFDFIMLGQNCVSSMQKKTKKNNQETQTCYCHDILPLTLNWTITPFVWQISFVIYLQILNCLKHFCSKSTCLGRF